MELSGSVGEPAHLQSFGLHKTALDATTKMLVRLPGRDDPNAVLVISRRSAPDLVRRGVESAESVRSLLGEQLGAAIIQPLRHGYVDGLSYVILPWCRNFSSWRPWRVVQRRRLRGPLLAWLSEATRAAVAAHGARGDAIGNFVRAIEHLGRQDRLSPEMAVSLRRARERLASGQWKPRHTFDHNDLYFSNIMLPASGRRDGEKYPFVLIDWVGANADGFGMWDLIRLSRASRISPQALGRQLKVHAEALECAEVDLAGHLLAALGRLHEHLEHFPEERFWATANACWAIYRDAAGSFPGEEVNRRS